MGLTRLGNYPTATADEDAADAACGGEARGPHDDDDHDRRRIITCMMGVSRYGGRAFGENPACLRLEIT